MVQQFYLSSGAPPDAAVLPSFPKIFFRWDLTVLSEICSLGNLLVV
jgi:hypothetical protein